MGRLQHSGQAQRKPTGYGNSGQCKRVAQVSESVETSSWGLWGELWTKDKDFLLFQ